MNKVKIGEVIVVEGRYDRNTLSQVVDAVIIETSGFGIFNNSQKQKLLRRMAETRGLIVLTDSDGAGFVIRNFIRGCVDPKYVKHAYIPEIAGKEKRKAKPSREGTLGVEGMRPQVLLEALRNCGAAVDGEAHDETGERITKLDMYKKGLSGGENSRSMRQKLISELDLPEKLSADALLEILNALMSREEFLNIQL
ncbi:MAG: toprim domain-containing protein [Candidatus Limivicinus sp.]|jgi:ribonuclease M5